MKKALVIVHFYYPEQTDVILDLLKNIFMEYDLYCTISNKQEYANISEKILKFKKDANIIETANVGYDVWPFVHIINMVDLDNYKYIIKLHTKRDIECKDFCAIGNGFLLGPGSHWRDCLFSFIANKDNFRKCINALEKPDVGMCARFNLIHGMPNHVGVINYAKEKYPNYVCGLVDFSFVAGTMFVAKAAPFQILKNMNISEDLFEKPKQNHETQFAHVIERTIGEIIYKSGMEIVDPFTPKEYVRKQVEHYKNIKHIKRLINYVVFPIFMPKYRRIFRRKLQAIFCMGPIIKDKNYFRKTSQTNTD